MAFCAPVWPSKAMELGPGQESNSYALKLPMMSKLKALEAHGPTRSLSHRYIVPVWSKLGLELIDP